MKFFPFKKLANGVSCCFREDGRICPCLLDTKWKRRKER
jgi:hypothetical protein